MTHVPYIIASYILAFMVLAGFGLGAWARMAAATRRLAAIDPRRDKGES